mgnify:CR=1 FL=1
MRDTTIPYYTATKIIAITLRAIRGVAITKAREILIPFVSNRVSPS